MKIFVRALDNVIIPFEVEPSDTIESLKLQIENKTGVSPFYQKLIFRGRIYEGQGTNMDFNIQNGDIIDWIYRFEKKNYQTACMDEMRHNASLPYKDDPNHMIIWLDKKIENSQSYEHLKHVFSSGAHPTSETLLKLIDKDHDEHFRTKGDLPITFGGVPFLFGAFSSVEDCIACFERNKDKRIFFITSGSMGRTAVPIILNRFQQIFTDPVTNDRYMSIYVFCYNIKRQMDWALNYKHYIQIFNFDADLFVRMMRDIADYYIVVVKRLLHDLSLHTPAAAHRLSWAQKLYERYREMEKVSLKKEFDEINALFEDIKGKLKRSSEEID